MSADSIKLNPSNSNPAISTDVLVLTPLVIRGLSVEASTRVRWVMSAIFFSSLSSTVGNIYLSKPNSSSSVSISISIIVNLSIRALSNCLVAVYSFPILAVAIKVTPFATLIVD